VVDGLQVVGNARHVDIARIEMNDVPVLVGHGGLRKGNCAILDVLPLNAKMLWAVPIGSNKSSGREGKQTEDD